MGGTRRGGSGIVRVRVGSIELGLVLSSDGVRKHVAESCCREEITMETVMNQDDESLDDRVRLLDEKVARLEGLLLLPKVSEKVGELQHLESVVEGVHKSVVELRESVGSFASFLGNRIVSSERKVSALAEAVDYKFDEVLDDLKMVKRALRNGDQGSSPKAKVREFEPCGKVHYPMEKDKGWRSKKNSSGGSPSCSSNSTQKSMGRRRRGCFACLRDDHLVRDCPFLAMMLAQEIDEEEAEVSPLGSSGATCVSNVEDGGKVQREWLDGVGLTPTSGQGRMKTWGERCEDPDSDEDYPPTTRALSNFGVGGLLYP